MDEALRVARATRDLDYFMEQPCHSYEECQQVRRRSDLPMKLDECITGFDMIQRVVADRGAEVVCLKISKQGGLSKSVRSRDYLVEHRIPVIAEDTWGGEIVTATLAHFAASTPTEFLVNATDLHDYNTRSTGTRRRRPAAAGSTPPTSRGSASAPTSNRWDPRSRCTAPKQAPEASTPIKQPKTRQPKTSGVG